MLEKVQKRKIIKIAYPDSDNRLEHVVRDAKDAVSFIAWKAIDGIELYPGDEIIVDVRIVVDHVEKT